MAHICKNDNHVNENEHTVRDVAPSSDNNPQMDNYLPIFLSERYKNCSYFTPMGSDERRRYNDVNRMNKFLNEGCLINAASAGFAGGALGLLFGSFLYAMKPVDVDTTLSFKSQVKQSYAKFIPDVTKTGKSFMKLGFLYSLYDCAIARVSQSCTAYHANCVLQERAKQDLYTALLAGCCTGGSLAWRGGIASMASGCLGFGLFSAAVEKIGPHLLSS